MVVPLSSSSCWFSEALASARLTTCPCKSVFCCSNHRQRTNKRTSVWQHNHHHSLPNTSTLWLYAEGLHIKLQTGGHPDSTDSDRKRATRSCLYLQQGVVPRARWCQIGANRLSPYLCQAVPFLQDVLKLFIGLCQLLSELLQLLLERCHRHSFLMLQLANL